MNEGLGELKCRRHFVLCPSHGRLLCPDKCVLTAGTASFAMQSAKRDMVYSFSG